MGKKLFLLPNNSAFSEFEANLWLLSLTFILTFSSSNDFNSLLLTTSKLSIFWFGSIFLAGLTSTFSTCLTPFLLKYSSRVICTSSGFSSTSGSFSSLTVSTTRSPSSSLFNSSSGVPQFLRPAPPLLTSFLFIVFVYI